MTNESKARLEKLIAKWIEDEGDYGGLNTYVSEENTPRLIVEVVSAAISLSADSCKAALE